MRWIIKIAVVLVGVYALLAAALLAIMHQPPERFSKAIAALPRGLTMRILPFRPLWFVAREGPLKTGDAAPDFDLQTLDRKSRVRLSSFRGKKPVMLVFGSYT